MTIRSLFSLVLIVLLIAAGCNQDYTPKPKEYPFIPLPEQVYKEPETDLPCPFAVEINQASVIERDTAIIEWKPESDCWMNIAYPNYNATIYLSYRPLAAGYSLTELRDEAHRLTFEHSQRADYIEPEIFHTDHNAVGLVYNVGGDAASATQFFVTDTTQHWLRGALYFRTNPNADSLAPVIDYINRDIEHLIGSLRWRE